MKKWLAIVGIIQVFTFFLSEASRIKSDETVVFFPAIGWRNSEGGWTLQIRGWIFEQEKRPGVTTLFRKTTGIDLQSLTEAEQEIFRQRTRLFLVDAEREKPISIQLDQTEITLGKSFANGHFQKEIKVSEAKIQSLQTNGVISFRAVLGKKDPRIFQGSVHLIENSGVSVISDIDDTIKISHVRDREKLLRKTFCQPFEPVAGMAGLYQHWRTNANAAFHFVSSSPSQLCSPLLEFMAESKFPVGSLHLSVFDWQDQIIHHDTPVASSHKPRVIEPLLQRFPQRRFILVGDSGELDPEIYGELARKFPAQVQLIFIRDVTNDTQGRYEKAFREIPAAKWKIFREPEEVESGFPKVR